MRTEPVPGSDPAPAAERSPLDGEEERRTWADPASDNDERLKADKPPHWG